ncbi:MAG: hypothetical protein IJN97_05620, partial [Oscillospiraceae bacterium]|nr:hypothetical protein [Oscillospiraceae bacterium]
MEMTAMQQIEKLCAEARAHGMTYGEYIEKFNPQLGEPEPTSKKEQRIAETRKAVEERERKRISEQLRRRKKSYEFRVDTSSVADAVPVSLWLGHVAVLIVRRTIIHCRADIRLRLTTLKGKALGGDVMMQPQATVAPATFREF